MKQDALSGAEEAFIQIALENKLLTQAQVNECLEARVSLRALGMKWTFPQITRERGLLTGKQIRSILRQTHREGRVVNIPGYTIIRQLGRGAMGAVYMAKQLSLNRVVALKVLSPDARYDARFVDRFQREAQVIASLRHRNIVAAFDFGEANGWYFMAMEYVEGLTVKKMVNRTGPLPENKAVPVALDIAQALKHAHARGIIHRDVKPGNIMLDRDGVAKLCDLGMAKFDLPEDGSITRIGTALGTPFYMSPEQARGGLDLDGRTDVYSLGATLFYMVTGDVPFRDPSTAVVMAKHLTAELPWPSDVNPKVSDDTSRVIAKMMAKKKEDRYEDADELIHDLTSLLQGGPLKAPMRWAAHLTEPQVVPTPPVSAARERTAPQSGGPHGLSAAVGFVLSMLIIFMLGLGGLLLKRYSDMQQMLDRTLEGAFVSAVQLAKANPEEYEENIERFHALLDAARGTKFEKPIEQRIEHIRIKAGRREGNTE